MCNVEGRRGVWHEKCLLPDPWPRASQLVTNRLHAPEDYKAQGERAPLLTMQILYPPLLSVFFLFDDCLFNNHFQFLWHFNGAESLTTTANDLAFLGVVPMIHAGSR